VAAVEEQETRPRSRAVSVTTKATPSILAQRIAKSAEAQAQTFETPPKTARTAMGKARKSVIATAAWVARTMRSALNLTTVVPRSSLQQHSAKGNMCGMGLARSIVQRCVDFDLVCDC